MKTKSILLFFAMIFFITSCDFLYFKDIKLSQEEIHLISKQWELEIIEYYTSSGDFIKEEDFDSPENSIPVYVFYSDYLYDEYEMKNYTYKFRGHGKWSFNAVTKIIKIDNKEFEILEITNYYLRLKDIDSDNGFQVLVFNKH